MTQDQHHHLFMAEALRLAEGNISAGKGGPFGAIVVKDGEIIAAAENRVILNNDPTAHAEIVAIREACSRLGSFQLDGCDIYTSCEPCPMCLGAIYWARPRAIYYAGTREDAAAAGFDDAFIYTELPLPPSRRKIQSQQCMRDEARAVFQKWTETDHRPVY